MNRARKTSKGLPRRVYFRNGAWYFYSPKRIRHPVTGKEQQWLQLAKKHEGEAAMLQALAKLFADKRTEHGSMPYLCGEFKAERLGSYGAETQAQYGQYLDKIADDFEEFYVAQVTAKDWADFLKNNFKGKSNTAQKYTALAKRLFRYAISERGMRQDNPIDQIDLAAYETKRRTALPTHDQVAAIRTAGMHSKPRKDSGQQVPTQSGPMFCCIIDMAYLCWARAIDVRMLKESQIDGDWIRFKPTKTQKTSGQVVDIFITPAIRAVIDKAREIKAGYKIKGKGADGLTTEHALITPWLFPTLKGKPYKKSGLFSMWDRAKDRAGVVEDVQFRDLRALGATDAARAGEEKEEIRKRLAHTSSKTSEIYIKEAIPERSEMVTKLPW
jgi:integrase